MIDKDGFRPNVGMIVLGPDNKVLLAKRVGQDAWQFPQGGIRRGESARQALFRELHEELGLEEHDVAVLGCTRGWLRYRLPLRYVRRNKRPLCIGQKQKWYLLRLIGADDRVRFDRCAKPEFDGWRWVDYWHPVNEVIFFKRGVYRRALRQLEAHLLSDDVSAPDPA